MNTVRGCVFLNTQLALGRRAHVAVIRLVANLYVQRRGRLLRTAQVQLAVPKVHYTSTVPRLVRTSTIAYCGQTRRTGRTRTGTALGYHTGARPVSGTNTAAGCRIRRRNVITPATAYLTVCGRVVVCGRSAGDGIIIQAIVHS